MELGPRLAQFPLVAMQVDNHPRMPLHHHSEYWELVLVTGGSGQHTLQDQAWQIGRGDVYVIPPRLEHGYEDCERLSLANVLFNPRRLQLPETHLLQAAGYTALFQLEPRVRARHGFKSRLRMEDSVLERVMASLKAIRAECDKKEAAFEAASTAHLCLIIVELARSYAMMTDSLPTSLLQLSQTIRWIEQNLDRAMNVDALAERARMSRSTFVRSFKQCFGASPMSYVTSLRIERAAQLLREPGARVKEVAPKVGIPDTSYFARLFRQHMGMEPTEYRLQHRVGQS